MRYQASRFQPGVEPSEDVQEKMLNKILQEYPHTQVPLGFESEKLSVTRAQVLRALDACEGTSSPGLPWASICATNQEVKDKHADWLVDAVLQRLELLANFDSSREDCACDPRWLVQEHLCDPVRLFIKQEPHTIKKDQEGRWRLISSVSLTDQVVERLLFQVQNEMEIDNWETCPSKPGIGLSLDEQASSLYNSVSGRLAGAESDDIEGWDFNVKEWQMRLEARARVALARASARSIFGRIVRARLWCLSRSVFVTSAGKMWYQTVAGWMKSGCYITSSGNSRMRVVLAWVIGCLWCIAMGDDSVHHIAPGGFEKCQELGFRIKASRPCADGSFEFCSHVFKRGPGGVVAQPLNWAKSAFRLLDGKPSAMKLEQFKFEYRHSPELPRLLGVIYRVWGDPVTLPW